MVTYYQNPPVVAVGIAFAFNPLSTEQWGSCLEFLNVEYKDTFADREDVVRDNIQILSRSDEGTPTMLKGETRITHVDFRDLKEQMLSVGRDFLAYYKFRFSQEDYPHFQIVLPKALEMLSKLREVVPDVNITQISVTYLDDLHFPINESEPFNLSDYMLLGIAIPETASFGHVFDFNFRTSHALIGDDKGSLQIQLMRMETDKKEYRIQIYWTCQIDVPDLQGDNQELLTTKLNAAHQYCYRCFEDSLTPKAKKLFNCVSEEASKNIR